MTNPDGDVPTTNPEDVPSGASVASVASVGSVASVTSSRGSSEWDRERLSLALEAGRLGDWSWDPTTDLVALSPRAAEMLGVRVGASTTWAGMRELLHAEDCDPAHAALGSAIENRTDHALEYRLVHEGRERWVSVSARRRLDDAGQIIGIYGVVQDMTRDRLLVRVDDALRSLVEPEAITYTAARVLGQYLGVNRCAYCFVEDDEDTFTLTGNYTDGVESIVGRYRFRQFGAECLRQMRAGEAYVVEDSETDDRLDAADREAYRLTAIRSVVCVPISKSGRFVAAMAVHMQSRRSWSSAEIELVEQVASRCWESIERARVGQERRGLLEAAEAANRAKDEFLAMLGHELRNPLAPIVTALHVMKLHGGDAHDRERTVIERQVTHLTRLVDDLLDVSRIARGKVELKRELIEIAEVVTRAVEVASPLIEARGHAVLSDVPPVDLLVDADAARLVQVFSNLLTNAAKYTAPAGRITISARFEGGDVVARVRDTGMGMTADVLPRVFDLFTQGSQAIDRARGGLGLGLSIVRSIVERHGGRVSAHSAGPEQGSEFVVRLPRARSEESTVSAVGASREPLAIPEPAAHGTRVLVVDDNVDAADMLAAMLSLQRCHVHVAHDGPQALRIGAEHAFDAALLDIGLPVMDGYELVRRLRAHPNFAAARLVAVTGYGQEADRRRAMDAGFHHHLVKPVDLEALAAIIANVATASAAASATSAAAARSGVVH